MTIEEKLFKRYSYLAKVYANKVFNEHFIGLEKQDIIQELSIKIFTAIQAYGESCSKWDNAKLIDGETNKRMYEGSTIYKPILLKYYIKLALINKVKDYIKIINREAKVSIEEINYDFGVEDSFNSVDFKKKEVVVNGVNLCEGLDEQESSLYTLFIKGYSPQKLSKVTKSPFAGYIHQRKVINGKKTNEIVKVPVSEVELMIHKQNKKWNQRKDELFSNRQVYEVYSIQD